MSGGDRARRRDNVPPVTGPWSFAVRTPSRADAGLEVRPETARRPAGGRAPAPGPRRARLTAQRSPRIDLLIALSAVAGVIHARAMVDHMSHYWLFGVFFGALTYAQVLWAVQLYRRPDDLRWLMPAAIASLAVVGIWIVSRTVGLPIGPWAGEAEPFGISDVAASIDELLLAAVVFAMLRPDRWIAARLLWLDGGHCQRARMMMVGCSLIAAIVGKHTHPATVR
jgi:hypothetical protein